MSKNYRYISAFPIFDSARTGSVYRCFDGGMTLRDYFAGQWIAGSAATRAEFPLLDKPSMAREFAEEAYLIADAMMEARDSASPCVADVSC